MIYYLLFFDKKEGLVNVGILDDVVLVYYLGINDVILCIKDIGDIVFCCKIDIRLVFRILLVVFEDYELLGFYWEGK